MSDGRVVRVDTESKNELNDIFQIIKTTDTITLQYTLHPTQYISSDF